MQGIHLALRDEKVDAVADLQHIYEFVEPRVERWDATDPLRSSVWVLLGCGASCR